MEDAEWRKHCALAGHRKIASSPPSNVAGIAQQAVLDCAEAWITATDTVACCACRLILDAIRGNQQHFVRRDELRAAWAVFTPLLHAIDGGKGPEVHKYEFGSRGVEAGDLLVEQAGYVRSSDYHWKAKM